jgi:hypothetical protein
MPKKTARKQKAAKHRRKKMSVSNVARKRWAAPKQRRRARARATGETASLFVAPKASAREIVGTLGVKSATVREILRSLGSRGSLGRSGRSGFRGGGFGDGRFDY